MNHDELFHMHYSEIFKLEEKPVANIWLPAHTFKF